MVAASAISVGSASLERYRQIISADQWREINEVLPTVTSRLRGRTVWNVNSTARGGGVVELLAAMTPYERGAGIDARWVVIQGSEAFFKVTKKIHNLLHGVAVDGSRISPREQAEYESTLDENASALLKVIRPRDVVILHDPQTVGLAPALARHGCRLVWRCHVGVDQPNDRARRAWDFLRPFVQAAEVAVFSRPAYAWEGLEAGRLAFIAPAIDAFTPKNRDLDAETTTAILTRSGIFEGADGSRSRLTIRVEKVEESPPPADARLVAQVSRWDPLKDPVGVLRGFADRIASEVDAHLLLAGPGDHAVSGDPGEAAVAAEVEAEWRKLAPEVRRRVHLVHIPLADEEQNAAVVNALQRHSEVVVQKSLAEGFGLTVAEAMWKSRPVVATRVGGIVDQVEDGRSGLLVDDPRDLDGFAEAVLSLLRDPARARKLGAQARKRVIRGFLVPRQLLEQWRLLDRLLRRSS